MQSEYTAVVKQLLHHMLELDQRLHSIEMALHAVRMQLGLFQIVDDSDENSGEEEEAL